MGHQAKCKYEKIPLPLNVIKKEFCVLQKKVLSFGPNRTVEVRLNSSTTYTVRPSVDTDEIITPAKELGTTVQGLDLTSLSGVHRDTVQSTQMRAVVHHSWSAFNNLQCLLCYKQINRCIHVFSMIYFFPPLHCTVYKI